MSAIIIYLITYSLRKKVRYAYLEGQFKVLAAPNVEAVVISSKFFKKGPVNAEKTSSHCWTPYRLSRTRVFLFLAVRYTVPVKL
jgi:hypothetical protein